jgi:hypothetical protein
VNQSLSLESVVRQFTAWRETYQKGRHTPKSLKQQAVALKSNYPVGQIINSLGINHRTLKRWSLQSEDKQPTTFISLPALLPENKIAAPQLLATCEFPNGIQLMLTNESLNTDLLSLIYQLKPEHSA